MRTFDVMVAQFPGNNQLHPASSGWVTATALKMKECPRIRSIVPWRMSDTPITMVRNLCVKQALRRNIDYLLMIDSDMEPDSEPGGKPFWDVAWEFMVRRRTEEFVWERSVKAGDFPSLERERFMRYPPATIAAPYCGAPPNEDVCVLEWQSIPHQAGKVTAKLGLVPRSDAATREGIQEVAALATGLILYDMRVFKNLPKPWFDYEWDDEERSKKASTEDVYQTRNASLLGMPQYVAWDCWAAHHKLSRVTKPQAITPADMRPPHEHTVMMAREGI